MPIGKRTMGLDVGSRTVGVAVSDLMGWTAQGVETVKINADLKDFGIDRICQLVKEHDVDKIVIGFPKNMNNSIGPRAQASMDYGDMLKEVLPDCEIIFQDERLTTFEANRMLVEEGDVSRKKRKQVIDKLAAVLILQNYLNTKK